MSTACSECRAPLPSQEKSGPQRHVCSAPCKKTRDLRLARERWREEQAAAHGEPVRTCSSCGKQEEVRKSRWPFSYGAPVGTVCMLCARARKRTVYAPAQRAKKNKLGPSLQKKLQAVTKVAKAAVAAVQQAQAQRSAGPSTDADALIAGAEALNFVAGRVTAEIIVHAQNPDSPRHREAVQFLAERILPMKTFNDLALELAREGEFTAKRRRITVQVLQTNGPEQQ